MTGHHVAARVRFAHWRNTTVVSFAAIEDHHHDSTQVSCPHLQLRQLMILPLCYDCSAELDIMGKIKTMKATADSVMVDEEVEALLADPCMACLVTEVDNELHQVMLSGALA